MREHHNLQPVIGKGVPRNGSGLQVLAHEARLEQLWSCTPTSLAVYDSLRMLSLYPQRASRPTPPPACTSFEARRGRFVGELEQCEGWEVGLESRAKVALLCRASSEEPIKSSLAWSCAQAVSSHPHAPHPHRSLVPPLPTYLPRLRATRSKLPGMQLLFSEKHNSLVWKPQTRRAAGLAAVQVRHPFCLVWVSIFLYY